MARKYFPFFATYYEAAQRLSSKDRAAFYGAIINYSFTATEPVLKGQAEMCWILVKPYLEKSMDDFLNGSKGGRPRKKQNPGLSETENPGFEFSETPDNFPTKTKKKMKKEDEEEKQKPPTAPPAAVAPHKGALGGVTALDVSTTDKDPDTKEALERFINSIRPSWAAADAAPPDVETEEE